MALHPEGVFTGGPLAHLVAHAAGPDPLEWEVLRLQRCLRKEHWDAAWRTNLQTLASQLDHLSVSFDPERLTGCPAATRRAWRAAAGDRPLPAFMTDLAMLLRLADRQPEAAYEDVPLAAWEVRARFPLLLSLDSWGYDDEHASFEDSVRALVAAEHPHCAWELVPRVGQALEARTLCSRSPAFAAAFRTLAPGAEPETLGVFLRVLLGHLLEEHGY
ncbi:hypothetical protein ACF065_06810 [Streptomyces sp. NPDC015232]|uniref:hypothetical protein n=1 Tax=unclassified Streptomyces TaxID=2593676 RepID=UPI0036FEF1F4